MNVNQPLGATPIGFVTVNGQTIPVMTNPEYVRFFFGLTDRVGGPTGPGTPDLSVAQFEDAGVEETKALMIRGFDSVNQKPDDLHEKIEALQRRVADLEQGLSL